MSSPKRTEVREDTFDFIMRIFNRRVGTKFKHPWLVSVQIMRRENSKLENYFKLKEKEEIVYRK